MLDFLRPTGYYQDVVSDNYVTAGADGNLVQEFMEMERIMYEQYESINEVDTQGTNQAYVCRVARISFIYECLDIAAPSTLRTVEGQSLFNESYTSAVGALAGNVFIHDNAMVDIANSDTTTLATGPLFGMLAPCGDKIMGDGVINAFDAYVIGAAQFGSGVYANISRAFDEVATVNGRNDTKVRCNNDPYTRLEWQYAIASDPCFTYDANKSALPFGRRLTSSSNEKLQIGRGGPYASPLRLQEYAPMFNVARDVPTPQVSGLVVQDHNTQPTGLWSRFGMSHITIANQFDAQVLTRSNKQSLVSYNGDVVQPSVDLRAQVFEHAETDKGKWYWINIPGIHGSIDLTIFGARNMDPISLSNLEAPVRHTTDVPADPTNYELRFIRHREFYSMDTRDCVAITSSRSPLIAMQKGVVSLAQPQRVGYQMCGFDLMLWKPANTPVHTADCPLAVARGSVTMNGVYGSVQQTTACSYSVDNPPSAPPQPLPPPPLPPLPHNTSQSPSSPTPPPSPPPPHVPCPSPDTQMKLVMRQKIAKSSMHGCHVNDVTNAVNMVLATNNLISLNETTTVELKETVTSTVKYDNPQCNVLSEVTVTTIGDLESINIFGAILSDIQYMKLLPLNFKAPTPCGNATLTISEYEEGQDGTNWPFVLEVSFAVLMVLACLIYLCIYFYQPREKNKYYARVNPTPTTHRWTFVVRNNNAKNAKDAKNTSMPLLKF